MVVAVVAVVVVVVVVAVVAESVCVDPAGSRFLKALVAERARCRRKVAAPLDSIRPEVAPLAMIGGRLTEIYRAPH